MIAMSVLFHPGRDPSRAYYGTDARAHTILIGVVLAVLLLNRAYEAPRSRSRPLELAGVVGVLFLVWACVTVDGQRAFLYRGGSALVAIATAAVIASVVTAATPHPLARFLSLRPLAFVGLISYGLYLWHWPIVLVLTRARDGPERHPPARRSGARHLRYRLPVVVVGGDAHPPRRPLRTRLPAVLAPVAALLTIVVLLATTLPTRVLPPLFGGAAASPPPPGFVKRPGPPVRTLLLGDSVAFTYTAGLELAKDDFGVDVITKTVIGCGIARGGPIRSKGQVTTTFTACDEWPDRWRTLVDSIRPDVVAIRGRSVGGARPALRRTVDHLGEPAFDAYLTADLNRAVDLLSFRGRRGSPCSPLRTTTGSSASTAATRRRTTPAVSTASTRSYGASPGAGPRWCGWWSWWGGSSRRRAVTPEGSTVSRYAPTTAST